MRILIFLLIILCGCREIPHAEIPNGIHVTYQGSINKEEINYSISTIVSTWEQDFGRKIYAPFDLIISSQEEIDCSGQKAIGCTKTNRTVIIVTGRNNELPSLYHELCHLEAVSFEGMDRNHVDLRWPAWTKRGFELSESIANGR